MLKRNETLSSLTSEMLAQKNIKKHKRLVLRLEPLYLVKKHILSLVQYQNSDQEKKSFLKVSFFEGTPRP